MLWLIKRFRNTICPIIECHNSGLDIDGNIEVLPMNIDSWLKAYSKFLFGIFCVRITKSFKEISL